MPSLERYPYVAALIEPRSSRRANSAARALSSASIIFCFCSNVDFASTCRLTDLLGSILLGESPEASPYSPFRGTGGISLMTPVDCHVAALRNIFTPPLVPSSDTSIGSVRTFGLIKSRPPGEFSGLLLPLRLPLAPGVPAGVLPSLLFNEFRGCLLVMPPRILRISSTSWIPSGGLGFFSLMYRSRWRPNEDEVKGCWQKGQDLSFDALGLF